MRIFIVFLILAIMVSLTSCGDKSTDPIPQVAKPYFSPVGGTYDESQSVSILCETLGVTIVYTTDGSDPNSSSAIYNSPIEIDETTTLKAKAFRDGMLDSDTASATFNIQIISTPVFDPPGGYYDDSINVNITCTTPGAIIRYTTDGTEPDINSQPYGNPIALTETTTIKAKAFKDDWGDSQTASATYYVSTDPDDSEWSVFFISAGDDAKPDSHYMIVMWIGDAADYVEPTTVEVLVDDVAVDLTETYGYWFGETTVVPGEEYGIELIIDGVSITNTPLEMVYEADVTFPTDYDPAATAAITWALADDNQSQMASALSFDNYDFEEDIYDAEIDPSDRNYLFPADAVEDFGDLTTFTLELSQMNYKHRDYVYIVSAQSDYQDYGFGYGKARNTPEEMIKYCNRLLSHIK